MAKTNVFNNGRVHVMERKCDTCIYRPGNLMKLQEGRREQMEEDAIRDGGQIVCHKTIRGQRDQESTCRGFFDVAKHKTLLAVAERLGIIKWTRPDEDK